VRPIVALILLVSLFIPAPAQPLAVPFAADIARFKAEDRSNPPAEGQILFVGSSTFTRWTDVGSYFPRHRILNRAFGGSTLLDQIRYANDVIFPYKPKQIVLYCGENDFATDPALTPDTLFRRFQTLYKIIRAGLPRVPLLYIGMKPSPGRWSLAGKFRAANRLIEQFCNNQRRVAFLSTWNVMLNEKGEPKPEIFVGDKLHMNADGYRLWSPLIEPLLVR
jgi:lysophospholipase L1-like esterase